MLGVSRQAVHKILKRQGKSALWKSAKNSKKYDDSIVVAHMALCLEYPQDTISQIRDRYFARHRKDAVQPSTLYRWRKTFLDKVAYIRRPCLSDSAREFRMQLIAWMTKQWFETLFNSDEKWFYVNQFKLGR